MTENTIINAFKANRPTFGVGITNGGFYHARMVVQASPHIEWVLIDCEHGLTPLSTGVAEQVAASHSEGKPALVRIPATGVSSGTSWQIKLSLDAGAKAYGNHVTQVSTAEKAAEVASDCRFPPVGRRGFGSAYGHTSWNMSVQEYLAKANDNILCIVQIETKEGIENLEKIAAVDGVDVLLLGPGDLSMAYGYSMFPELHPEVEKMIQRVKDVAHAHEKRWRAYSSTVLR
ncbi:phosphoenolpyruvate pyruvate domain-containing protein, partial [Marasmius fiardii PR-910]